MIDINPIIYLDLLILKLKRVWVSPMVELFWSYLPIPLLFSHNQKCDVTRLLIDTIQILYLILLILKLAADHLLRPPPVEMSRGGVAKKIVSSSNELHIIISSRRGLGGCYRRRGLFKIKKWRAMCSGPGANYNVWVWQLVKDMVTTGRSRFEQ